MDPRSRRSGLFGRALDRLLVTRANRDPARLRLLGLLDVDLEHAVAVVSADRVLADALRQADGAREAAELSLEAIEVPLRRLLRALAFAGDGQGAVVELDRDLVLGNAGKIESVDELVVLLPHVHRG